jgi:hypothetical protein
MSRLDPIVAEENRLAYHRDMAIAKRKDAIAAWLHANPSVGVLNSGKFYIYTEGRVYKEVEALSTLPTPRQGWCYS